MDSSDGCYKEGEISAAICCQCKSVVRTRMERRDYTPHGWDEAVPDILVAVCTQCDRIVAIPHQSTHAINARRLKMHAHRAAKLLNEMLKLDPEAICRLVFDRVPCNKALADHPTLLVGTMPDGSYEVGLLGILNGLVDPEHRVVVTFDEYDIMYFSTRESASFGSGAGRADEEDPSSEA